MQYFKDGDEKMFAFQIPDEDTIYGVLYINRFGAFIRANGSWVGVTPDDATFEDTIPYEVNPETVDQFLSEFDSGELLVDDAEPYITAPVGEGN